MKLAGLVATALILTACVVQDAQMRLPVGLAQATTPIEVEIGGWAEGSYRVPGGGGTFNRRADRLGIFDPLFVRSYGASSFTFSEQGVSGELAGRCGYSQTESGIGVVSVTPKRLAYRCSFRRDGRPLAAELELKDRHGFFGSPDGREAREGIFWFDGRRYSVRSVHEAQGGALPLATPLGYVAEIDGRPVAAFDLNGTSKTFFVPAGGERHAMLALGLSLALLWDPAETSPTP